MPCIDGHATKGTSTASLCNHGVACWLVAGQGQLKRPASVKLQPALVVDPLLLQQLQQVWGSMHNLLRY